MYRIEFIDAELCSIGPTNKFRIKNVSSYRVIVLSRVPGLVRWRELALPVAGGPGEVRGLSGEVRVVHPVVVRDRGHAVMQA